MESPESVDAAGLLKAIQNALASLKMFSSINNEEFLDEFYKKIVNVNFDGASVMSGHLNGVQAKFKNLQPGIVYTHCVAHKLELAVLDAIKHDDKYLGDFDDMINNILKFYFYSPVRRKELKEIAELLQDDFKQMGLLKNIRWVSSRSRALKILESNYKAMVFDLESKSYGSDETSKKARGYLQGITKPQFLFYLHFLQDYVENIKELSLIFQRNDLLVCEIPRLIEEKIASLDMLSISSDSVKRLMENLTVDEEYEIIYKEVTLSKSQGRRAINIDHNPQAYLKEFNKNFETIIEGTKEHLINRFSNFKCDPLSHVVSVFDFKQWPKSFSGSASNKAWGIDSVELLAQFYFEHNYLTKEEMEMCKRQWPVFRNRVSKIRTNKLCDVYVDLLKERDPDIKHILIMLEIMCTFSASTAQCERGSSAMNSE